jgi:hypothetical protein
VRALIFVTGMRRLRSKIWLRDGRSLGHLCFGGCARRASKQNAVKPGERTQIEQRKVLVMKNARPVSVMLVATVSAAVHGAIAVLVVPMLSFLYLISSTATGQSGSSAEFGMTIAVLAPLLWAAVGFGMGALMSTLFNLFVNQEAKPRVAVEEAREFGAAVGDAA